MDRGCRKIIVVIFLYISWRPGFVKAEELQWRSNQTPASNWKAVASLQTLSKLLSEGRGKNEEEEKETRSELKEGSRPDDSRALLFITNQKQDDYSQFTKNTHKENVELPRINEDEKNEFQRLGKRRAYEDEVFENDRKYGRSKWDDEDEDEFSYKRRHDREYDNGFRRKKIDYDDDDEEVGRRRSRKRKKNDFRDFDDEDDDVDDEILDDDDVKPKRRRKSRRYRLPSRYSSDSAPVRIRTVPKVVHFRSVGMAPDPSPHTFAQPFSLRQKTPRVIRKTYYILPSRSAAPRPKYVMASTPNSEFEVVKEVEPLTPPTPASETVVVPSISRSPPPRSVSITYYTRPTVQESQYRATSHSTAYDPADVISSPRTVKYIETVPGKYKTYPSYSRVTYQDNKPVYSQHVYTTISQPVASSNPVIAPPPPPPPPPIPSSLLVPPQLSESRSSTHPAYDSYIISRTYVKPVTEIKSINPPPPPHFSPHNNFQPFHDSPHNFPPPPFSNHRQSTHSEDIDNPPQSSYDFMPDFRSKSFARPSIHHNSRHHFDRDESMTNSFRFREYNDNFHNNNDNNYNNNFNNNNNNNNNYNNNNNFNNYENDKFSFNNENLNNNFKYDGIQRFPDPPMYFEKRNDENRGLTSLSDFNPPFRSEKRSDVDIDATPDNLKKSIIILTPSQLEELSSTLSQ